jgi:hypothetical protein
MKCVKCGNNLQEGQKFCNECGTKADGNVETNNLYQELAITEQPTEPVADEKTSDIDSDTQRSLLKKIQCRIGFKTMLLIAFVSFFFPFCTVSCSGNKITSPSGYQMVSDFGLSKNQLDTLELEAVNVVDTTIGLVIIIMVCGIFISGAIKNTLQAILAIAFMIGFKHSERFERLSTAGMQVDFRFGYYLAFTAFLLAATAFIWAPTIMSKICKNLSKYNQINSGLSGSLIIITVIALVTNPGVIRGMGAVFSDHDEAVYEMGEDTPVFNNDIFSWNEDSGDDAVTIEESSQVEEITDDTPVTAYDYGYNINNPDYYIKRSPLYFNTDVESIKSRKLIGSKVIISGQITYASSGNSTTLPDMTTLNDLDKYFISDSYSMGQYEVLTACDSNVYKDDYVTVYGTVVNIDKNGIVYIAGQFIESDNTQFYNKTENNSASTALQPTEYYNAESEKLTGDPGSGYVIEGSDSRYLTEEDLRDMSKGELRLARNEIYARHGRLFSSADLQDYFNSMNWYVGYIPVDQFDESVLNDCEKANLIFIKSVEDSR